MRPRIAILDDYTNSARSLADWTKVEERCDLEVFTQPVAGLEAQIAALGSFDAIVAIRERMAFPRALLEQLPQLTLLVTFGSQNRSIDYNAASDCGVEVIGTGNSTSASTVELTWALILGLTRRLVPNDRTMRNGGWQELPARELTGSTLGVIGFGRLGRTVATIGRAFGMEVLAWSPHLTSAACDEAGVHLATKTELLQRSDVVTLHLVLSETTKDIIGRSELDLMKPSAILINTARGRLVDTPSLVEILRARKIAAAGLDVFDEEPLPADHPFRSFDNTLLSPHMGFVTEESLRMHFSHAAEILARWSSATTFTDLGSA